MEDQPVTVGHHTLIRCNVTIRGTNRIGNYTHIYDNVNIEADIRRKKCL